MATVRGTDGSEMSTDQTSSSSQNAASAEARKKMFKTTLCAKFVTNGACPFGSSCNFAHGVRELRAALDSTAKASTAAEKNPHFKTSLCKNYMVGHYCPFADQCQYAHGRHELRDKVCMIFKAHIFLALIHGSIYSYLILFSIELKHRLT